MRAHPASATDDGLHRAVTGAALLVPVLLAAVLVGGPARTAEADAADGAGTVPLTSRAGAGALP